MGGEHRACDDEGDAGKPQAHLPGIGPLAEAECADQRGEQELHAGSERHGARDAQIVEALDLQYLGKGPGNPVRCRGSGQGGRPDDGVYQGNDDGHGKGGEHHAHLLAGTGASDLMHDNALEAPAKRRNEFDEDGTHDANP